MSSSSSLGDFKLYFIVGTLLAISIVFMYLYAGNFLGLQFEQLEKANNTDFKINQTQELAVDTNNETRNQTQILVDILKNQEKNRERSNNTTNQILANQAHQIKLLEEESKVKVDLLTKLEAESKAKQIFLEKLENESQQKVILLNKLENESKTKQMLLDNQQVQLYYLKNQTLQNQLIIKKLEVVLNQTLKLSEQNLNISKQHIKVAEDHDNISKKVSNVTNNVDSNLYRYGENSIEKLDAIVNLSKQILHKLDNVTNVS